jgi:hypothetical protein
MLLTCGNVIQGVDGLRLNHSSTTSPITSRLGPDVAGLAAPGWMRTAQRLVQLESVMGCMIQGAMHPKTNACCPVSSQFRASHETTGQPLWRECRAGSLAGRRDGETCPVESGEEAGLAVMLLAQQPESPGELLAAPGTLSENLQIFE